MYTKLGSLFLVFVALVLINGNTEAKKAGLHNLRVWIPVPALGTVRPAVNPAPAPALDRNDNVALMIINSHRLTHQAPPVTYSAVLKELAAQCANRYVATNPGPLTTPLPRPNCLGTTAGATIGFNGQTTSNGVRAAIDDVNGDSWFSQYINNQGSFPPAATAAFGAAYQDYTQMIWVSSTQVGCAWSINPANFNGFTANIYICLWTPAGNVANAFPQNVLADV